MTLPHALPPMREVVKHYQLDADKSLGQHFLFDLNLTDKIVRNAGKLAGKTVVEIGPGPGALTRALLQSEARKVIAIDRDRRCLSALKDYLLPHYPDRLVLLEDDALKSDMHQLLAGEGGKVSLVSNLPYNVGTPLLFKWLDTPELYDTMTLMFQKEVADRITATPGSKAYGRLSVMAQWRCAIHKVFDLPPTAFVPAPKIWSSVLHFTLQEVPAYPAEKEVLENLCRAVFNQRRKTLRVSLKQLCTAPEVILERAGIDSSRRPETLSLEEFCTLARVLAEEKEGKTGKDI